MCMGMYSSDCDCGPAAVRARFADGGMDPGAMSEGPGAGAGRLEGVMGGTDE